jgi:hypothetical protein
MYCISCGSLLPNEAQFCPRCGKRNGAEAAASRSAATEPMSADESEANLSRPPSETNSAADGTALLIGSEGSEAHQSASEARDTDGPPEVATGATVIEKGKSPARYANPGSITLGVAALICVVLGVVQGFIPIFLIEGVAFGGLAWLCAAKWPLGQSLHSIVLVGSLLLAGLAGVSLDQDTFGPRYRYLSQGSVQYRVDEKAGRTDRLGNHGWYPVAYESEAKEINALDVIWAVNLTKGYWEPAIAGGNICFNVSNTSGYILDRMTIEVQTQRKNADASKGDAAALNQQISLKSYGGGFIGAGDTVLTCASSPRDLATDETWSYSDLHIYGWKR